MNEVKVNIRTPKISVEVGGIPEVGVSIGAAAAYPVYTGATTVDPSESQQVLPTAGLNVTSDITVNAVSSTYVGSGVTRRDGDDLSASGATVTAPAGYYENAASATVASGSATTPATTITANPSISVDSDGLITATASASQSVTPTVSAGYVSSGTAGTITVSGSATSQLTKRTSADLTASGNTVTAPAGFYPSSASKAVAAGSAATPATTITANPSISVDTSTGVITATASASQSVTPTVSAGYVSSGTAGTVTVSGSSTENLTTQGATTITPTTSSQTAVSAGTFVTGDVDVAAMPNGVRGSGTITASTTTTKKVYQLNYSSATSGYYPASTVANPAPVQLTRETQTVTPDETGMDVTPTGNFYYLEKVTVNPIPNNYVGSGIAQNDSSDLTVSGATVTAPAGYYANNASATISGGSVGLPYATKGTVSGHAVNVTPFVTSTTGYITGATRTGTAVSVSASELVSGTLSISSNGTGIDVTNYAAVDVAVSGGTPNLQTKTNINPTTSSQTITADTGYDGLDSVQINAMPSGSATAPAAINASSATVSTGTNTLTLSKTVSVTPAVSAGYVASGTAGNSAIALTASVTTQGATTYHPSTSDQTITSPRYLTGTQTINKVTTSNLTAENIKSGVIVKVGDTSDDDCVASVTGTYSGGGGSSWTLLGSKDATISTTSTSAASATTLEIGSAAWTDDAIIYVKIRDKAGPRAGYFLGSDNFFFNYQKAMGLTSAVSTAARITYRVTSSMNYNISASTYGVYAYSINTSGTVNIYRRYNSTNSLTINGTFNIEVYKLDYAPNQGNPFNYLYS